MADNERPKAILAVRFFKTALGKEPVREWLKACPAETRRTIGEDIKTVQFGWPLGMPLVRKMNPGLWEMRSRLKDGIVRVFFTVYEDMMILLHVFVKKGQKTPSKEIEITKRRLKEL